MTTATLSRSARLVLLGTLAACAALAWLATVAFMSGAYTGPAGMDMAAPRPWAMSTLALGVGMWAAMMAAMMLPSAAPMITAFAGLSRRRLDPPTVAQHTATFVGGYLLVWSGFSVVAALVQQLLAGGGLLPGGVLGAGLAGVVLAGAGVYQLTPTKQACLRRCRTPLGFLLAEWRDGAAGSTVMGLRHGLWCAGCCLPLMLVMFAVGVMSLLWMAVLALVVLAEKALPFGAAVGRLVGVGAHRTRHVDRDPTSGRVRS